jgi:hypothetical protein
MILNAFSAPFLHLALQQEMTTKWQRLFEE